MDYTKRTSIDCYDSARKLSLVRIFLLAAALGIFSMLDIHQNLIAFGIQTRLSVILGAVIAVVIVLVLTVRLVRSPWQLVLHLVFDLIWCGAIIYFSAGVTGPGISLLFVVVLAGNFVLPGMVVFILSGMAGLVLVAIALLYLLGASPFPPGSLPPSAVESGPILSKLFTSLLALFIVDSLGQGLARRYFEQGLVVGGMLDQIGEGVLLVDKKENIVHINDEALRLLHLPEHCRGQNARLYLSDVPLLIEMVFTRTDTCLKSLTNVEGCYVLVRCSNAHGRKGKVMGRILTMNDETDVRRLEIEARRSEHLSQLGEMAAGIAHEVRNPLASLRGCAQELGDICAEQGSEDATPLAAIMIREADRLSRIVDDFLRLSKQSQPNKEGVCLTEFFYNISEQFKLNEQAKDVIEIHMPDNLYMEVDIDHLYQIIINLINNAIEAVENSPAPLVLVTGSVWNEHQVLIEICDNGCGIPDAAKEKIFTPFYSTRSQGTGLGLSLVQRLIRANGGSISVRDNSDAAETGTRFQVLLPMYEEHSL